MLDKLEKEHSRIFDALMKLNVSEDEASGGHRGRRRRDGKVRELKTIKENIGKYRSNEQFLNDIRSVINYGRQFYTVCICE
jgi:hypothetical protein